MTSSEPIDAKNQIFELPSTMMCYYGNVQLVVDTLHVNDVTFLTYISNHAHYRKSNAVDNMKAHVLEACLLNVLKSYAIGGFSFGVIFLCIQFKCVKDRNRLGVTLNIFIRG